jgi:transposase
MTPWKASSVIEERLRFVGRLLDGESMTDVCREFGISRKTGYKVFDRYKEHGLEALTDRSRRPVRYANQLPPPIEGLIVRLKGEKPHWGARKIRELLLRRLDGDVRVPAKSTSHAVLDRHRLGRQSDHAAEATLTRYRLSQAWPLDHGRVLTPSGTTIDSNSADDWSRLARGLTPPWDVQALDDECYQLLLRAYPGHRHLMSPPPPPSGPSKQEETEPEPNKQTLKT